METDLIYQRDAYQRDVEARVVECRTDAVALEKTVFYPKGGGQPHDEGVLRWEDNTVRVTDVRTENGLVWHQIDGECPPDGGVVHGQLDWARRYELMRTHTALHILCGVIWNEWGKAVTGGNMTPLSARMDFEFDPLPDGFASRVAELVNAEIKQDRPIEISFMARGHALEDEALIRTKVNLIPESVQEIRVVEIVGLDKQADGGTHVSSTGEVGRFEVVKTESKGKTNKRVRVAILDA